MASPIIKTLRLSAPMKVEYEVAYSTTKEKRKFVEDVKRVIRSSLEYKDYIRYLRENMDMDQCAFFSNVKAVKGARVSIEIHHEPFTLDDIVRVIINKTLDEGKPLNDLDIADQVMELHYRDMVGLVPLSKTIHEVIHPKKGKRGRDLDEVNPKIYSPLGLCYGNYKNFIEEYENYFEDDILDRLEKKIEMTKNPNPEMFNALQVQYEYLDVDGVELPKKLMEEVQNVA